MAAHAQAFCRTTTCDVPDVDQHPECLPVDRDDNDCSLNGAQLFWPGRCISFGVQENGSKRLGISWQTTDAVLKRTFGTWSHVDCGGGMRPSIDVYDLDEYGPMLCPTIEFNQTATNANIWLYRDDKWPYENADNALALTTTTFDMTGRILDADVEINSFSQNLTTSNTEVDADLESILMHETGHFLGLAHEVVAHATMNKMYEHGSTDFRSLEADDVAGICSIYPPDRDAVDCKGRPDTVNGFSRYCGGEADTGTVRSELSTAGGGACACSFGQSSGHEWKYCSILALAALGGVRRKRRA